MSARTAALCALLLPTVAWAQDEPRFCPNRPTLQASPCVTEPGRVHLEMSVADWQRESDGEARVDTLLFGDFEARLGVDDRTEVQLAWSPYGHVRTRDRATGMVERAGRAGDVRLALRRNFSNPDGSGPSYAVEPFATLPVGRTPVGGGDWGAGVVLPVTYDLAPGINIGASTEWSATPDEDGHGRHFQATGNAGVTVDLSDTLSTTLEAQVQRDRDPAGHATPVLAGAGVQWNVSGTRALYGEVIAGLNHQAPDVQMYAGISALF